MSDPYAEVTRREGRSGLSGLGWFLAVVGSMFVVGLVGVAGVGLFLAKKASTVLADFRDHPVEAFVDLASVANDDIEVVSKDESEGTVTLRVRDTGDEFTVDLSQVPAMLGAKADPALRLNGEADESGGVLTVSTPDGETRIELRGGEDGGFLRISTPDEEMHFGAGGEARSMPRWVPLYPGAKVHKRLFSAETEEGRVGAALLRIDEDPETVLSWYRDTMPGEGFTASVAQTRDDDGDFRAKVEWTSKDGDEERDLSVAVGEDSDGDGFLLLFYRSED